MENQNSTCHFCEKTRFSLRLLLATHMVTSHLSSSWSKIAVGRKEPNFALKRIRFCIEKRDSSEFKTLIPNLSLTCVLEPKYIQISVSILNLVFTYKYILISLAKKKKRIFPPPKKPWHSFLKSFSLHHSIV